MNCVPDVSDRDENKENGSPLKAAANPKEPRQNTAFLKSVDNCMEEDTNGRSLVKKTTKLSSTPQTTMCENSPPIGSKGSYNIDWDNFDDSVDPFATKPKVYVDLESPDFTHTVESKTCNLAHSPLLADRDDEDDAKAVDDPAMDVKDSHLPTENDVLVESLENEISAGDQLKNGIYQLLVTDEPADIKKAVDVGQQEVDTEGTEEAYVDTVGPVPILVKAEPVKEGSSEEKPGVGSQEPILENEDPIVENEEPILENDEPILENEEPILENEEPILENEEPILDNEEPTLHNCAVDSAVDFTEPPATKENVQTEVLPTELPGNTTDDIVDNNNQERKPLPKKNMQTPSNSKIQRRLKLQSRFGSIASSTRRNPAEDLEDIQIFIPNKKAPEKAVVSNASGAVGSGDAVTVCKGEMPRHGSVRHATSGDYGGSTVDPTEAQQPAANLIPWCEDSLVMNPLMPTEEEFRPATEFFQDQASWDLLENFGSNSNSASLLARQSLYVKFDPLVKGNRSPGLQQLRKKKAGGGATFTPIKEQFSDDLLLMSTPPTSGTDLAATNPLPPQPKSVALLQDVDAILACSPAGLAAPASKAQDEGREVRSAEVSCRGGGDDGDIVQVLKYSQSDVTRMKKEWEMESRGHLLAKEKDYQTQIDALRAERDQLKEQLDKESNTVEEMRTIMSEYEKTITQLIADKENTSSHSKDSITEIIKERDQALEDLQSVENAFSDLHRRYEKSKQTVEGFKKNEETLKKCVTDYQSKLKKQEERYQALKTHAEEKLEAANQEIEKLRKGNDQEMTRLSAALKRAEMKNSSMEQSIEQKEKENRELVAFCDELIAKVGSGTQ